MKKMIITTALATSLIAGVASADTSVSAYIETTIGSGETPATSDQTNQGTTIGYEHGLSFSGSKDLDNGMTLKTYFDIEDGDAGDARGITFVTGDTQIMIEADVNNIDDKQAVPTIINKIEDGNKGLGVSYNANKKTIHNDNGIGVKQKFDMATVSLKYVPKTAAGAGFNDSNPNSANKGSGMAYGFEGGFGIDGLNILYSRSQQTNGGLSTQEPVQTVMGASYNFGNIKVGAQHTQYDDVNGSYSYSAGAEAEALSYAATMAVNDQLSVGIQYAEFEASNLSADEEITSFSAGYNLGGATIGLQYHEAENVGGTAGKDGEAIELRLKQSF